MSYFADTYAPCIFALASVIWKSNSPCSFNELAMAGRSFQQLAWLEVLGALKHFLWTCTFHASSSSWERSFRAVCLPPDLQTCATTHHELPSPTPTPARYLGQMLDSCPIPLSPIWGRNLKVMLLLSNSQSCVTSIGHLSLFLGQCFEKPGHWVCTPLLFLPPEEEVPELCVMS